MNPQYWVWSRHFRYLAAVKDHWWAGPTDRCEWIRRLLKAASEYSVSFDCCFHSHMFESSSSKGTRKSLDESQDGARHSSVLFHNSVPIEPRSHGGVPIVEAACRMPAKGSLFSCFPFLTRAFIPCTCCDQLDTRFNRLPL